MRGGVDRPTLYIGLVYYAIVTKLNKYVFNTLLLRLFGVGHHLFRPHDVLMTFSHEQAVIAEPRFPFRLSRLHSFLDFRRLIDAVITY